MKTAILKTRRMGYDGKGQAQINSPHDAQAALDAMENTLIAFYSVINDQD